MSVATNQPTRAALRERSEGHAVADVLLSEWTKIRTVRSTYWTMLTAAVTTIGVSALVCVVVVGQWVGMSVKDRAGVEPASLSLTGGILAQLAIAVLGVLVVTSEYGSGMIRTTFAAVPQRLKILAAKSTVFGALTLVVAATSCLAAFLIGQSILSTKGIGISITSPNALRTILGTALYLTILGLLALGLGTLIRKTAGAISAVVGMIFVLPVVSSFLPSSMQSLEKFLPSNAGQAIISGGASHGQTAAMLSPWVGLGVFGLYAIAALAAGAITLVRRDA